MIEVVAQTHLWCGAVLARLGSVMFCFQWKGASTMSGQQIATAAPGRAAVSKAAVSASPLPGLVRSLEIKERL
jgi:hypothetical protein